MDLEHRIQCFARLRSVINQITPEDLEHLGNRARSQNGWFTPEMVKLAFQGISHMLEPDAFQKWVRSFPISDRSKTVGIVMAGNIPMVGFHDLVCVLMAGHKAAIKTSSKDDFLIKKLLDWIIEAEESFRPYIEIQEKLQDFDAVIATGSDNSSRYFEYYFSKYPYIIRKNRTSVAVLDGNESDDELRALGHDVYDYYGLGCRNVSKIFLPEGYDIPGLLDLWQHFSYLSDNHKFQNNYDYHKSILLINREKHLDTGFSLLKETEDLVSPISLNYYQSYGSLTCLKEKLTVIMPKIQCIVTKIEDLNGIPFGSSQKPELWDFADQVDTMDFLVKL